MVVSICTKDAQIVHGGVNQRTKMIWCLEEDQSEFLEERRQWDSAEKHCQFIGFSINFYVERSKEKQEHEEGTEGDELSRSWHEDASFYSSLSHDWKELSVKRFNVLGRLVARFLVRTDAGYPSELCQSNKEIT